jgi:exodeoxyribonuclease V alpha subunit
MSFSLRVFDNSGEPDPGQRELTGVFASRRQFFVADDGEGGTIIGALQDGKVIRGFLEDPEELQRGLTYKFFGGWDLYCKWGPQFVFDLFVRYIPREKQDTVIYLADHIPHIGKATAMKLWDAYGADTIKVLTENPVKVAADGLLSYVNAVEVAESLRVQAADIDTKVRLHGLLARRGFPKKLAASCLKKWGASAAERIERDPFTLLINRFPFCSFPRCDQLYLSLNLPPGRLKRQGLCAWNAIASDRNGHTWLPIERAIDAIRMQIAGAEQRPEKATRLMIRSGWLAHHRDASGRLWIATAEAARQERTVARKMTELLRGKALWPAEATAGLSEHQRSVLGPLLSNAVFLLLGTPGTGKTFVAAALIRSAVLKYGQAAIGVAAPTGKAAVRLTENLEKRGLALKATTIHRLLGCQAGRFAYAERNPLPYKFIVINELSMLDVELASHLLAACGPGTNLLMVGDAGQLAPVSDGCPLRDFIDGSVPHGELTEIQRNSGMIVRACARVRAGLPFETCNAVDLATGKNLRLVEAKDNEQAITCIKSILDKFRTSNSRDVFEDVQILTATRDLRRRLNLEIQNHLNPNGKRVKSHKFRQGDRTLCTKNGWLPVAREVRGGPKQVYCANGDLGRVEDIGERSMIVRLRFPERVVRVPLSKANARDAEDGGATGDKDDNNGCAFDLGYAITCHKFQGSEAPVVIVVADKGGWTVASKSWWYTALSRAKELCILVGRMATVGQQCRREVLRDRKTFLAELLKREMT